MGSQRRSVVSGIRLASVLMVALGLALLILPGSTQARTVRLTFGVEQPRDHTWALGAQKFADTVAELTGGQVTVDVFTDGQLGSQREMLEGISLGTVDGVVTLEPLSLWVPEVAIWGILYLFENQEHLERFVWGPLGEEFDELARRKGFRVIAHFMRQPRQISSKRPIRSLADLQGLKIRVPQAPTSVQGFNALGAKATPMAFTEVYQALYQGVLDAQENPLDIIYSHRLYEVTPYIAMTDHQRQVVVMVMSERRLQSLTPEQQEAVLRAGRIAEEYHNQVLFPEYVARLTRELEQAGVTFTYPDQREFAAAVASVTDQLDPALRVWVERIRALGGQ